MSATVQPQPVVRPGGHPAERQLRQRLSGLRRRMRMVALIRGLGWLVLCVLATVLAAGLLDYRFHLPGLVRAFLLIGLLVGTSLVALRYLIQPLAQPVDDLALALRIEERYPLLNDGLASTVEFLQRTPPEGESASMRGEAVRRTLGKVAGLDFHRVIDAQGLRTAVAGAAAALAAAVLLGLLYPTLAATAVARLASPFGSIAWPHKTRFELERVVLRIGRNREYRLRGTLHGVIPPEVTAEIQNEGFPTQHKTLAVHPDDHTFTLHLRPEEIQRNFIFQLHANDASTEEFRVEVLPLPILVPLNGSPSPQIRLAPPAYTDLPPSQMQPGMGNLEVVAGTLVTLRAATDRPLRRAWIEYQPDQAGANQAACLAVFGTQEPLGVLSARARAGVSMSAFRRRWRADGR
ncbi:MAG: hypothetical protein U0840_27825 [Gemmataceae bacterium]